MGMADKIKERRLACGYTQEELADKLGLQKSAVAKYENGRVENIKRSTIEKMSKILDCSPAYLMGWNDDDTRNTAQTPQNVDIDMTIIQRERSKMSDRQKSKLMNILKANFDDFNWEEDDSGDIE